MNALQCSVLWVFTSVYVHQLMNVGNGDGNGDGDMNGIKLVIRKSRLEEQRSTGLKLVIESV